MTNNKPPKPIVAIDFSTTGKGGGPYVNGVRIMTSELKNKYNFKRFNYNTKISRGISIKRILDIKDQLIEIKPDIVHFTGLQLSGFHIAIACKLAKIKNSIVTIRGFSGDAIDLCFLKRLIITCFLEPITLLLTKRFYCVSKYVSSRFLVKLFNYKNDGIIYNLSPPVYKNNITSNIREELRLSNDDVIVVSVGRITKDKGYHILDEAILQLKNEKNLKFIIVGYGDYYSAMSIKLNSLILKRKAFLLGYREDIQRILSGCDLFVLPTLHETLSNALLEASAEGLALIASNTGGVPEIVKNNYNGLLVSPGNISDLVISIRTLLNDQKLRMLLAENSKKQLSSSFLNPTIVKRIDEVYLKLINLN